MGPFILRAGIPKDSSVALLSKMTNPRRTIPSAKPWVRKSVLGHRAVLSKHRSVSYHTSTHLFAHAISQLNSQAISIGVHIPATDGEYPLMVRI